MLASNVIMLVRVITDCPEKPFGYARLRLGTVGEGEFNLDGEVRFPRRQSNVVVHVRRGWRVRL